MVFHALAKLLRASPQTVDSMTQCSATTANSRDQSRTLCRTAVDPASSAISPSDFHRLNSRALIEGDQVRLMFGVEHRVERRRSSGGSVGAAGASLMRAPSVPSLEATCDSVILPRRDRAQERGWTRVVPPDGGSGK